MCGVSFSDLCVTHTRKRETNQFDIQVPIQAFSQINTYLTLFVHSNAFHDFD